MPPAKKVYMFRQLINTRTFLGLPGLLADSLPEKYGNSLLEAWLRRQGKTLNDVSPVERLCLLGNRGMGALEYEPDLDSDFSEVIPVDVHELISIARRILRHRGKQQWTLKASQGLKKLIQIGTSAGGAKAKAVIAWNEKTNEVRSGQADCPPGFGHWLMKFSEVENGEDTPARDIGRIEYAYYLMANLAGITMMESRLYPDGETAHFMTRRFDRTESKEKLHVQSLCAMMHADRNPVAQHGYELLFQTARKLQLGQAAMDELYRRMLFNIMARNQDDHTKNHAFIMDRQGHWYLAPAFDLCFAYRPGNAWIEKHQLRCNGKRDDFTKKDLLAAAQAADIKHPARQIEHVQGAISHWPQIARDSGVPEAQRKYIQKCFRKF
jgi:serine/threonine-protein kinase HipA